jgi:hypothetical protein
VTDIGKFVLCVGGVTAASVALAGIGAGVYALSAHLVERRRSAKAKQQMIADYAEMVRADLAQFDEEFEAWLERQVAG